MAVTQVMANSSGNFLPVIGDIDNVPAAFTSALTRTNVYDRTAQERTLANADAGVSDQSATVENQLEKVSRNHILEEVEVRRFLQLTKSAYAIRGSIRTSVNVWPK